MTHITSTQYFAERKRNRKYCTCCGNHVEGERAWYNNNKTLYQCNWPLCKLRGVNFTEELANGYNPDIYGVPAFDFYNGRQKTFSTPRFDWYTLLYC